ncbi:HlyD family secretion protein [Streptococcus dentasini]
MREKIPPTHKERESHTSPLLRENRQRQRGKGLFRVQELIVLGVLVVAAIILLAVTDSFKVLKKDVLNVASNIQIGSENLKPKYAENNTVQITAEAQTSIGGKNLERYRQWIGKIDSENQVDTKDGDSVMTYTIKFENGDKVRGVTETDITEAPDAKFGKDATIQISHTAETDLDGYDLSSYQGDAAEVTNISYNYSSGGGYKYDVKLDDGTDISNIAEASVNDIYHVPLKQENSAADNNQVLKDAFNYAKDNPGTILGLPSGDFTIGTQTPETDYITLASDTQIRGDRTKLIVDGAQYWFGFATGTGATDGVQNFTMRDITVEAKDLEKGNQFMIMVNHGSNWTIENNTFTMVHKIGSHVFDLGGLQNSSFEGNTFEGYAPELTDKTDLSEVSKDHDIYAEAIQFDTSDSKGEWDGNFLKNIDSNYGNYNQTKAMTSNISVTNNSFIPYKDKSGKIIAYGASIGQHSGDVSNITVSGNTLTDTLTSRFHQDDNWMFKPIHFTPGSSISVYSNTTD